LRDGLPKEWKMIRTTNGAIGAMACVSGWAIEPRPGATLKVDVAGAFAATSCGMH
jgi:hypothetical protein